MSGAPRTDAPADAASGAAEHPMADLAPAYAVGALDADERDAFEAHLLAGCARCADEARAYGELAAELAHAAAGDAAPPAALRTRIVAAAAAQGPPPVAIHDPAHGRAAARQRQHERSAAAARRRPAWAGRAPWLAAAASLVLAAGFGAAWGREREARLVAEAAVRERAGVAAALAAAQRDLLARDSLVAALTEPDVRTARLAATGAEPAMRLTWNRRRGVVVVTASALAAPAPGRTYQLWGIRGREAPQSLGTFAPDAAGRLRVVLRVPPGAAMDLVAVTDEPAGGSARATTAPVMVGTLGA